MAARSTGKAVSSSWSPSQKGLPPSADEAEITDLRDVDAWKPTECLKHLYYDSMVFTPEGLRHQIAEVDASQISAGTDYPFPWTKTGGDHIVDTLD